MEKTENTKGTKRWFWLGLISSWLTFAFFPLIKLGIALWVIVLTLLIFRKSWLKWILLGCSPWILIPVMSFSLGTTSYFNGQAKLNHTGFPSYEFRNLDPQYRVWNSSSGCMVTGSEPFSHYPNNFAVKFWTKILGIQKNVYTGIYPTKEKTKELLHSQGKIVRYSLNEGEVLFQDDSASYKMYGAKEWIIRRDQDTGKAEMVLLDQQLLIFKPIHTESDIDLILGNAKFTYLSDVKTGNIFARYVDYQKSTTQ